MRKQIKEAIACHALWKQRLLHSIETGKSEFAPDQICCDSNCDFGRWLYGGSIPEAAKRSPHYETCRNLHAEFHREAANILRLALNGQTEQAIASLGLRGKYVELSSNLVIAMMAWMDA